MAELNNKVDKQANLSSVNEADDSDYDTVTARTPLKKKASFALPPLDIEAAKKDVGPNKEESTPLHQPNKNNLSIKVKEKLANSISNAKPEKPREFKLRAFVAFLFLAIIFLVGFAYIFYYQQLNKKAYFERIRFVPEDRLIRVFDDAGLEAVRGFVGANIPPDEQPYKCQEKHRPPNSTVCFEWMNRGRFSLFPVRNQMPSDQLKCYRVLWQSLSAESYPTDCFEMNNHVWYGAGAVLGRHYDFAGWPLNKIEVPLSPFVTGSEVRGHNGWGPVLRRYFISSKAAAVIVDDTVPLWVSVNSNQSQKLCLQARGNQYPFYDIGQDMLGIKKNTSTPSTTRSILNYTICTSTDLETLAAHLADTSMWDGLRKDEMEVIRKLMEDPIWRFHTNVKENQTAVESLMKYTNDIVGVVWTSPGYLLIDSWEEEPGDMEFDQSRFQDLEDVLEIIHRKGFKIAVTIRPFVSTFSTTYKMGLELPFASKKVFGGAWIAQPFGEGAPALTSFNGDHSMAVPDVTSAEVSQWLTNRLRKLVNKHDLDGIFIESMTVDHLPRYYVTHKFLPDPSTLSSAFLAAAREVANVSVIGITAGTKMPRLPTFVAVPWLPSSWEALQTLLPLILTLGVTGYPFLIPPPIGGFMNTTEPSRLPERELYIRWMQVTTFLPVVQFAALPSEFDADVEKIAGDLSKLRQSIVLPLLQKYGGDSVINGLPIIRPLWMLDPFDRQVLELDDEFCVGDELLIAPVLFKNQREREVYLPKGVWRDGIDGSLRKGGRWIHHYKVTIDQVSYFVRMPDGTRL